MVAVVVGVGVVVGVVRVVGVRVVVRGGGGGGLHGVHCYVSGWVRWSVNLRGRKRLGVGER